MKSIEDLIAGSQNNNLIDEESAQGKFKLKQKEINVKEMERVTKSTANNLGVPYIDLASFPISPEAISLIKEKDAQKLCAVCFYYDGKNIRIGTIDPTNQEIKKILDDLKNEYHSSIEIYLISENSLIHALNLYKTIPKVREYKRNIEITEDDLNKFLYLEIFCLYGHD